MNNKRIIELLEDQLRLSSAREKALVEQVRQLSTQTVALIETVRSLEQALLQRKDDITSLKGKNRGLGKLLSHPSEKVNIPPKPTEENPFLEASTFDPKERGNNQAKRKEFFDLETVVEEVYPSDPGFDKQKAKVIGSVDSILYCYIPAKFIKHIYRQYNCLLDEKVYSGKAPKAPLLNSNYDASFTAGMLQLRYIYSMPVERIVKYFAEYGFDINKATAHGLIKKSAVMMERLDQAMKKAILEDSYISMDESYYTILTKEKNHQGKGVRKGYIWAALSSGKKLVHYFYQNGSRSREVLTNYIGQQYQGAIQSDGLANYKILESEAYPDIIRLACFQHCKRNFLDIQGDENARQIVELINSLYRKEHEAGKDWKAEKILKYRKKYAPPILDKIKRKLLKIQSDPQTLPQSPLSKAINYMLGEYDALSNYIRRHDYALDNNAIERCMRYISLSRKNSLFCGSHAGAERTALIYSLACSCRLHRINTFEYFTDILNKLAYISPNALDQTFRDLLPDRWNKN